MKIFTMILGLIIALSVGVRLVIEGWVPGFGPMYLIGFISLCVFAGMLVESIQTRNWK